MPVFKLLPACKDYIWGGQCRYFTTDGHTGAFTGVCAESSFHALLVTEGCEELRNGDVRKTGKTGE